MTDLSGNPVVEFFGALHDALTPDEDSGVMHKVRVEMTSEELSEHFEERADYHFMKAEEYAKRSAELRQQAEDMRKNQSEEEKHVSDNPAEQLERQANRQEQKAQDHEGDAAHFAFMADHVVEGKKFRLSRKRLNRHEITPKYR